MRKLNKQLLPKVLIFYLLISSTKLMHSIQPSEQNLLLNHTINKYNDVTLSITKENARNLAEQLDYSLDTWKRKGYGGIWLHIPLDQSDLTPIALKLGFTFHHATDKKLVMTKWLKGDKKNSLPDYATHVVGVAGLVIDKNNNILVVKEKYKPELGYKLPGGGVEKGEDLSAAAIREVEEETGIKTKFLGIVAWRQGHPLDSDHVTDLYFACLLEPITSTITIQENEILEALWMPYNTFKKRAQNSCAQFLAAYEVTKYPQVLFKVKSDNSRAQIELYAHPKTKI